MHALSKFILSFINRTPLPQINAESVLARGATTNGLLRIVNTVLGFSLTLLVSLFLGIEGFGNYIFGLGAAFSFSLVARLGLPSVVVRVSAKAIEEKDWTILRGIACFGFCSSLITSVLIGATAIFLTKDIVRLDTGDMRSALVIGAAMSIAMTINSVAQGLLRSFGQMAKAYLGQFVIVHLISIVSIGFIASSGVLTAHNALLCVFAAWLVASIVGWVWVMQALITYDKDKTIRTETRLWSKQAFTMAAGSHGELVSGSLDILVLAMVANPYIVGVYGLALRFAQFVNFTPVAISSVLGPAIVRLHVAGATAGLNRKLQDSARIGFAASIGAMLVVVIAATAFVKVLQTDATPLILLASVLSVGFLGRSIAGSANEVLLMTGKENAAGVINITAVLMNMAMILAFTPWLGVVAPALSTAIAVSVREFRLARAVRRNTPYATDLLGLRLRKRFS